MSARYAWLVPISQRKNLQLANWVPDTGYLDLQVATGDWIVITPSICRADIRIRQCEKARKK